MIIIENDENLVHYGTPRHSGRYPWGSGEEAGATRNPSMLDEIKSLKKQGLSDTEIAKAMRLSTTEYRAKKSIAVNAAKQDKINQVQRLKDKGYGSSAIAKRTGLPESTVRSYLEPGAANKQDKLIGTAEMLKKEVAEKKYVDVGTGAELAPTIGLSSTRFATSVAMLTSEGYKLHQVKVPQVNRDTKTTMKILTPPGTTQREVWENQDKIQQIVKWSDNGGKDWHGPQPPLSISSKRIGINHKEDGGDKADGVIFVRPGVKDVELGGNSYAQVRIKVDDTHFIKGMAVYKDGLPAGTDIVFNTSKPKGDSKKDVLKQLSDDPSLPFGSIVRQIPKDGKPTSVMNIVNDEGDWAKWNRTLSSQMLSKQSPKLAKTQLDLTYANRLHDYEQIKALTNPIVRQRMLMDFAGGVDSAAINLKAASMPHQAVRVLLPIPTMPVTQVYAPGFRNGEKVVLIRHPHAGPFEIPELTVNNKHAEARRLLGEGTTAIGIHHDVAKKLSGADFDGDTVLVIPNNKGSIHHERALRDLKDFDPVAAYPGYPNMRTLTKKGTQPKMGEISNLITDMSIAGASRDKLAKAVKHSMVVIDAEKKGLDYRRSYDDNNIKALKEEFQTGGASTLISRKKSTVSRPEMKPRPYKDGGPINKTTGELEFITTDRKYKSGTLATKRVNLLSVTKDAHELSSGTPIENLYAAHSNKLKALANQARLDAVHTEPFVRSPTAAKTYKEQVDRLDDKLYIAKRNAPLERQSHIIAQSKINLRKSYNPQLDKDELKKISQKELNDARNLTGAKKHAVEIEPDEWDAIQAGAISPSKLKEILTHADMEKVRALATPKTKKLMTPIVTLRAQAMLESGATRREVADALGVSLSTLDEATKEG